MHIPIASVVPSMNWIAREADLKVSIRAQAPDNNVRPFKDVAR